MGWGKGVRLHETEGDGASRRQAQLGGEWNKEGWGKSKAGGIGGDGKGSSGRV